MTSPRNNLGSVFAFVSSLLVFAPAILINAQSILIDAHGNGRTFDGVGAVSGGGGNSRLLIDYPEPYRSQILDYLFKPNYGANLQVLKVEIGSDMDSTDGAESSHMHTAKDENYNRGYEWWLMEQAKARNPQIKLIALAWGAPQWVGNGNYWSHDMIDYTIRWLKHAQTDHNLTVEYLGGRNEHGYDLHWYKELRAALRTEGLSSVKVIASDDWPKATAWAIATDMKKDPAINDAIDIVGVHGPAWAGYPPADALALNKPLWDSEAHFDEKLPYKQVARNINRNYIAGKVTATVFWPIVSAMYDNLPYDDIGMIKCNQPWSGHYSVTPSMWVVAHTTQFAKPGWRYIDSGSGFINGDKSGAHGSFVALQSADSKDYSVVLETVESKTADTVAFRVSGFSQRVLHLWSTNPASLNSADWFVRQHDVSVKSGRFSVALQPGYVYSLSTTTGQGKGNATSPRAEQLRLPLRDDFEGYAPGKLAKYFSDMYGGFETAHCTGGRAGMCLRQVVPAEPTAWKPTSNRPFTMIGSLEWTDYRVSSDVMFEQPGSIDLIGRLTGMSDLDVPNSYVLRLSNDGSWSVVKMSALKAKAGVAKDPVTLTAGSIPEPGLNAWHTLSMTFSGARITAHIDGQDVGTVEDADYAAGIVGIGTAGYIHAQFDNFRVEPLAAK